MAEYRHCITESGVDRQRQFEEALLELMGQKSYSQIAVLDICERVSLSRKSFYRYFGSKEACLWALLDHALLDMTDIPLQGEPMQQVLERYFSYWKQRRPLLDALCRNGLDDVLFARAMACADQEFGIRTCLPDSSSYTQTTFFVSGIIGVLLTWHRGGCAQSPASLAASISAFFDQKPHSVF